MRKIKLVNCQNGFSLLEVLVALALLGVITAGFTSAILGAAKGADYIDRTDTSRALVQGQMEYVKKLPFSPGANTYPADPDMVNGSNQFVNYPGYSVSINASSAAQRDASIQTITISVFYRSDVYPTPVATLQDCKAQ